MKEAAFLSGAAFGIALMALVGAALFWLRHRDGSAIWRIVADFFDWVSRVSYTAARAAETAIRIHDMVKAGGLRVRSAKKRCVEVTDAEA